MTPAPVLPFLISYAVGIVFRLLRPISVLPLTAVILGGVLAALFWWKRWNRTSYLLLCVLTLLAGIWRVDRTDRALAPPGGGPSGVAGGAEIYEGRVESYPSVTQRGHRFRVRLSGRLKSGVRDERLRGSVALLSLSGVETPRKGEQIRFRARLSAPRNLGNDREFDFERYSRCRDIDWVGTVASSSDWVHLSQGDVGWLQRTLNAARDRAIENAGIYMEPERVPLYLSLVLGDLGGVSHDLTESFRRAGIIHLLVVSGLHVVMAAAVVAMALVGFVRLFPWLLLRFPVWQARAVGGMMGATLFCLLTDLPVPTLRALLAVLLILAATFLYRPQGGWNVLFLVAFALLIHRPLWMADVSFQLSILAVAGILSASMLSRRLLVRIPRDRRVLRYLASATALSVGASLFTVPPILWHFGQLAVWTIPANLIFVPTVGGVSVPLGMAATFLSALWPGLAGFLFCLLDRWLELWIPCIAAVSQWPGSSLVLSSPPATSLAAYAVLIGIAGLLFTSRLRGSAIACAMAGSAIGLMMLSYFLIGRSGTELHFIHVGQGDATFLRTSGGKTMLIDAGPGGALGFDAGERVLLPWFRVHGYGRLDVLAITHDDVDHTGGATAVMSGMEIGEIWSPRVPPSKGMENLRRVARDRGIPWKAMDSRALPLRWGDALVQVVHPGPKDPPFPHPDNNSSLVLRIDVGLFGALLTGDLEKEGEALLIRQRAPLRAALIKIGHHGSRTSTSENFLDVVHPRNAVLSVGWRNRYHHPAPLVLQRLARHSVRIWRGDQCGEITFQIGPESHSADAVRPCKNHL